MSVVKNIIRVVWPIVVAQLKKMADNTETEIDDYVVHAIDAGIMEWLNSEEDE